MRTVNDGTRGGNLSFLPVLVAGGYPATPEVTNLLAAQSVDTTRDFALKWASLNGSTFDIVQVLVLDGASNVVFASPAPFQANALNGTSNSVVIPAFTLPPGLDLMGHLAIARPGLPNSDYALGVIGLAKDTAFPLRTRLAPVPPRLEVRPAVSGLFRLRLIGEADRNYHLQGTTNFHSWADLLATNPPTGEVEFIDAQSPTQPRRFYRAQVGP
jgi:hypothetical protein